MQKMIHQRRKFQQVQILVEMCHESYFERAGNLLYNAVRGFPYVPWLAG